MLSFLYKHQFLDVYSGFDPEMKIILKSDLEGKENLYIITWMLHQIFMYSYKVILTAG